ncbi:peptidoglycan editing factor PgeF [Leekyejoonella antrihumi]|uniref:Purine nucleoside phosphorylase n=1 Tax=Leekyejoonella antrihumi TaxID=1660198 RepID=A0A563DYV3_9MICO|nr:peptidoglycan editing factor PgeF [Leekyejoonella antrihumi]TWP35181.1 peptidoglycan editing factor PgeF [Leekyejoonella antrihumi]
MLWWQDHLTGTGGLRVDRVFTDRLGGVSSGAMTSLNLGGNVGDDPVLVEENRGRLATAIGVPRERLVLMNQVHGRDVQIVTSAMPDPGACDGTVTTSVDLALVVLVADCTPVLLADVDAGVVAAVHAGRPGMTGRIVNVAIDRMRQLGGRRLVAAVGPSVCGRCYEVPAQMRDAAQQVSPSARAVSWTGTPAIDVAAGVVQQLHERGVEVTWVPGCTRESHDLFSYREDQQAGRQAGVIVLRTARA